MGQFREKLGFYSCTVPGFEQVTLARFLSRGHFEKHINRMRRFYRRRRNQIMELLRESSFAPLLQVREEDAGLHFLVKVDTHLSDAEVTELLHRAGIRIKALSSYYRLPAGEDRHLFVVNYSSLDEQALEQALKALPEQLL